jgi:hypothetical protein
VCGILWENGAAPLSETDSTVTGYRIDEPGTITFTVGVKIKGKVEKPQVMIFLSKEKTIYRNIDLNQSFLNDIMEKLPFVPEAN